MRLIAGRVGEQQRVAVRRGARSDLVGKDAGSARHVLDEHRPADCARHRLGGLQVARFAQFCCVNRAICN
jgi:hypothetical protein